MIDGVEKTLKDVLETAAPKNDLGNPSLVRFAAVLGISYQAVMQWTKKGQIPAARIPQVVKLSRKFGRPIEASQLEKFSSANKHLRTLENL